MTKSLIAVAFGLLLSSTAMAQEWAFVGGFHQTDADTNATGYSTDGKLGFSLGANLAFELVPGGKFRTGLLYTQRYFDLKPTTGTTTEFKFAYLDVPALFQYNINEMFGIFGGLVVAINVSDKTEPTVTSLESESLVPLLDLGVNLTFDDMIGFDFYYQKGMGDIATFSGNNVSDFSTFGANFVYWF